jgi:DNA-binding transcriptional LysR family regulator
MGVGGSRSGDRALRQKTPPPEGPLALRVSEPRCFRTIGLSWVKKRYLSAASRTFIEFVRARYATRAPKPNRGARRLTTKELG